MSSGVRPGRFAAFGVVLLTMAACRPQTRTLTAHDLAAVRAWLTCDECVDGERDTVRSLGAAAIPELRQLLLTPSSQQIENMRAQYGRLYSLLPSSAGVDSATFVDRYLRTLQATISRRAAISLGDLEARGVLQEAVDSAAARGDSSLGTFLRGQLLRSDQSVGVANGTATSWRIVSPSAGVEVCNGEGTTACMSTGTTGITARATGPAGTFANPWTHVYFYGRPTGSSDPPDLLGEAGPPTITETPAERRYEWGATFGAHGWPLGAVEVYGVGVGASGSGYRTEGDSLITVVEGR